MHLSERESPHPGLLSHDCWSMTTACKCFTSISSLNLKASPVLSPVCNLKWFMLSETVLVTGVVKLNMSSVK